jgi:GYF domain 2/Interferon-induced transmembrane protein
VKKYFIIQNGQQVGPLTIDELKAANINGDTNVWFEGLGDWQKASTVSELSSLTGGLLDIPSSFSGGNQQVPPPVQTPSPAPNYGGNIYNSGTTDHLQIRGVPPKTWLVESILVTLFCGLFGLIFGIAGIVNASKVESAFYAGDLIGAQRASEQAGKWTKFGFFGTLIFIAVVAIFVGIAAFLGR